MNVGGFSVTVAPVPGRRGVVVASTTLQPGQVTTINGVPAGVPTGGNNLVISGTSLVAISQPDSPILTFAGSTITANPSGGLVVAPDVTLSPGGLAVTVSGTTLSLAPSSSIAVLNRITQTLGGAAATGVPVLTVNGQPITAQVSDSSQHFSFLG